MDELSYRCLAGAILLLSGLSTAKAQNLLENGEFDFDTAGWEDPGPSGDLTWETIDHDSCGDASGSALLSNSAANTQVTLGAKACATGIVPGQLYSAEGFLRFPTGQSAPGAARLYLQWFESEVGCSGPTVPPLEQSDNLFTDTPGVWVMLDLHDTIAPAGAHSAEVSVALQKNVQNDTLQVRFDGIHLGPGYLFADGFETDSTCRWSADSP